MASNVIAEHLTQVCRLLMARAETQTLVGIAYRSVKRSQLSNGQSGLHTRFK